MFAQFDMCTKYTHWDIFGACCPDFLIFFQYITRERGSWKTVYYDAVDIQCICKPNVLYHMAVEIFDMKGPMWEETWVILYKQMYKHTTNHHHNHHHRHHIIIIIIIHQHHHRNHHHHLHYTTNNIILTSIITIIIYLWRLLSFTVEW